MLDQERLLGLSARLSIMEVPEDVERDWMESCDYGARVVADAFYHQLQVSGCSLRYECVGFKRLWKLTVTRLLLSTGGQRQGSMCLPSCG